MMIIYDPKKLKKIKKLKNVGLGKLFLCGPKGPKNTLLPVYVMKKKRLGFRTSGFARFFRSDEEMAVLIRKEKKDVCTCSEPFRAVRVSKSWH